jgi:hypothetical protein
LLVREINAIFVGASLMAVENREAKLCGVVGIDEVYYGVANLFFILDQLEWAKI